MTTPNPVLTRAKMAVKVPFRKILVATDFSPHSGAALTQAVQLAERTGAQVSAVHVVADGASHLEGTSFEAHWRVPPREIENAERALRREAEERLDDWIARHRGLKGVAPRTEVAVGVPFVEVIRLVQKRGYDLVL